MQQQISNEADQAHAQELTRPTPINIESSFYYNELFFFDYRFEINYSICQRCVFASGKIFNR